MHNAKHETLRLLAEILALTDQKRRPLQRWREARRLCEKEQLSRQKKKSQTAAVKRAVRAYKRRKLEDLAGELEQAVSCNQVKTTYAMVKRLAPVQAPPMVTVRQKDGSPTWGHDGEITPRRDALVTFLGAEPLSLEAEPQLPQAKKLILPETPVTYKTGDAQWAVAQLSNGKAVPCIRSGGPADQNKFGGAGCRAVESGGWTACAGSTFGMCTDHCCSMDRERPQAVFRKRTKMLRLLSFPNQEKTVGCQELENHRVAQPHRQGMGKRIGSSTYASSCKSCRPMPVWLTPRKEHARCSSHPGKRVRKIRQLESPSKSPQLSSRRFLV